MLARNISLAVILLLTVLAAAASASFEAGEWYYVKLFKPGWHPPPWMFGPAWAVTYLFAALAAWTAWLSEHYERARAMLWWLALLVLNVVWSFLYFGIHRPGWAWLALGITLIAALFCFRAFWRVSTQSAWLLTPYLLWIVFCWVINLATWTINGGVFSWVIY